MDDWTKFLITMGIFLLIIVAAIFVLNDKEISKKCGEEDGRCEYYKCVADHIGSGERETNYLTKYQVCLLEKGA